MGIFSEKILANFMIKRDLGSQVLFFFLPYLFDRIQPILIVR
jgi:hypothetical protein